MTGGVMATRNGNYCAFYVAEPFSETALHAHTAKDFRYYNMLRMWKGGDSAFPFVDSHDKTYSVRDGSDWEATLKPRLRERLRASKNVVLFLSDATVNSRALRDEVEYGINDQSLPVIVIYPDYESKATLLSGDRLKQSVKDLWDKLPAFRNSMHKVPTLHVPLAKSVIESALRNKDFMLATKATADAYHYKA
jgi:hypothetical protein